MEDEYGKGRRDTVSGAVCGGYNEDGRIDNNVPCGSAQRKSWRVRHGDSVNIAVVSAGGEAMLSILLTSK